MNKGLSMERLKILKWVPDDEFCQVKMFIPEGCPSQIGSKPEDHLQIMDSLYSNQTRVDDRPKSNQTCIPQIRWKCPLVFTLKSDWQVVAGEESEEKNTQNYRQTRVLEALYPCLSAIPSSPSVSPELEVSDFDDTQTSVIPLTPIEEEDTMSTESTPSSEYVECIESNATVNEILQGIPADADVFAAASVALTAMLKCNEKGSMVDTDLLIKILKEPKMFEALLNVSRIISKPDTITCSDRIVESTKHLTPYSDSCSVSVPVNPAYSQLDISRTILPSSSSTIVMSNASSSGLFIQPDRLSLQNLWILDGQPYKTSLVSSVSSENLNMTLDAHMYMHSNTSNSVSVKPMDSISDFSRMVLPASTSEIFQPNRLSLQSPRPLPVSSTRPEDPKLTLETRALISSLPSHSCRSSPFIKDINYYKNLIRLHGMEGNETQEKYTPQYQVSAVEIPTVSGQGHAKPRGTTPCKYFNSLKGCKNGSTCPFEHVPSPNLRARSFLATNRSKRLKISAEITGQM